MVLQHAERQRERERSFLFTEWENSINPKIFSTERAWPLGTLILGVVLESGTEDQSGTETDGQKLQTDLYIYREKINASESDPTGEK